MIKLLIIEDDPLMSRMYQKIFSFEGYAVELAGDGEEGLAKVRTVNPTLILLDIMMPKLNGLEVLDRLKADPELKAIPVVILTNLAGQQDAETALAKGAVKYIIKSEYDPKQVADLVKEILAGYTRNEVPGSTNAAPAQTLPQAEAPAATPPPVAPASEQPASPITNVPPVQAPAEQLPPQPPATPTV